MAIEIILHGVKMTVSKDQLFELAANGAINQDTPVNVSGKLVSAKQIKGLVFGRQEEAVSSHLSPSYLPIPSHSSPTSRLSKKRCINVGVILMVISVLLGFVVGFIAAANNLWELLWIFGPLESVGFFVGFVMFIIGLTLAEEKQANSTPLISPEEHYKQALVHFLNKEYDEVLEMCDVHTQSDFLPDFYLLCVEIWNSQPDNHDPYRIARTCSKAIEQGMENNDVFFLRGNALKNLTVKKGRDCYQGAMHDLSKIPKSDKNYKQAQESIKILEQWQRKGDRIRTIIVVALVLSIVSFLLFRLLG